MGKVVGIDLGTTFSAIAIVNEHGRPEIIPNREGERITPSVVLFEDGTPIVGRVAKQSAVATPLDVVQFIKRKMGDPSVKFHAENGDVYTPEDISAMILKRLKEDAETMLGETISDAVITVPAYFNDAQRKATQDAGRIADLNVLRIINEPTAAALAYGIDKVQSPQNVLVYDLGGGTFDVTIMKVGDGKINVLATGGDKNLGGFDWDNKIMEFLNDEFMKQGGEDLLDNPTLEQDLRDKAETAKKTLTEKKKTKVFLFANGKQAFIELTREQFEVMTLSLLKRTAHIMEEVLEESKLTWDTIDKILLVGGSTRMKAVPTLIEKVTRKEPSSELHPDEVVAVGAALQGALLHIKQGSTDLVEQASFPLVEIKDVNSHNLGVVIFNEKLGRNENSIVLNKNMPIPGQNSKQYSTIEDNQTGLIVQVTESEGEEIDLKYVNIIGESVMDISPYPKGAPIEVTFKYDHDGIIHVSVFDLTANKFLGEMKIKRESNLTEEEVKHKRKAMSLMRIN